MAEQQSAEKEASRFLPFRSAPYGSKDSDGNPILNRYSSMVTNGYEFPGAQAMLYAAGVKDKHQMQHAPHVGMYDPFASCSTDIRQFRVL